MILSGRTWLITGGAAGIGLELATAVAERGNRVIVCGRSQQTLDRAQAAHPGMTTYQCDVSQAASRASMVAWLAQEHPD